jgi:TP53 regulating kinase-like protein
MRAKLHDIDTVHGDLTTSNLLVTPEGDLVMIDFGLSYGSNLIEDKAVDLYVLERAISSTHPISTPRFFDLVLEAYRATLKNPKQVLNKFADVQLRGRKREMIG